MLILATILSAILLSLATLHVLWGFGFWVPLRDEERLVAAVVGAKDVTRMPGPIPCGLVAALLLIVVLVIWGQDYWLRTVILSAAAAVFILRGVASYLPLWRKMTPQEPFASNDRRFYGPLCLLLGIGVAVLLSGQL